MKHAFVRLALITGLAVAVLSAVGGGSKLAVQHLGGNSTVHIVAVQHLGELPAVQHLGE